MDSAERSLETCKITGMSTISPFFTIITVCFNAENEILNTIKSILTQKFQDFEYIIIDGGSTDTTNSIIAGFGNRIRHVSEPDNGIYYACNKGLELASGTYVNVLMAGDAHSDEFLSVNHSLLQSGIAFSYGGCVAVGTNGSASTNIPRNIENIFDIVGMPYAHPSLVVRTDIARILGGFDVSYRYASDLDFICRLYTHHYGGRNSGKALSFYSVGGVGNSYQSLRETWKILTKYRGWSTSLVFTMFKQIIYTTLIRTGAI